MGQRTTVRPAVTTDYHGCNNQQMKSDDKQKMFVVSKHLPASTYLLQRENSDLTVEKPVNTIFIEYSSPHHGD